jgi:hypothetical protein
VEAGPYVSSHLVLLAMIQACSSYRGSSTPSTLLPVRLIPIPYLSCSLYCCSCGYCGGEGCHARPGGEADCCGRVIEAANVHCSGSHPPCVLKTKHAAGDTIGKQTPAPTAPESQTPEEISNSLYTNKYSCTPKCVAPEACAGTKAKPKAYACRADIECDTAVSSQCSDNTAYHCHAYCVLRLHAGLF